MLELQKESENQPAHVANDAPVDEGTKFVDSQIAYDPETTLIRAEVVIALEGGGGVSTSFFQFSGEHDREAEAALVRQAAEMLLEHAENLRNRPGDPRSRPPA
jgi:hypothetical protein